MAKAGATVYRPQPGGQTKMLASSADIVIAGGGAGGGKSIGLLLEPTRHIHRRGFEAVLFRRTSPQITRSGGPWQTAAKIYPGLGGKPVESPEHMYRFPAGSRITFSHLQHEKDKLTWDGAQIALLLFDQLEHFTWGQFSYLLARNRSDCGVRPYVRASANPVPADHPVGGWLRHFVSWWIDDETGLPIPERDGVLRYWVTVNDKQQWADSRAELLERFGDAIEPGDIKSVTFILLPLDDNKIMLADNPGYRGWLKSLPRVHRERLLNGNWNARESAGTVLKRHWFQIADKAPMCVDWVRAWDRAATDEQEPGAEAASYTAGPKVGMTADGTLVLADIRRFKRSGGAVFETMKATAKEDGHSVTVAIFQDPGAAGKTEAQSVKSELERDGFTVVVLPTAPPTRSVGDNVLESSNAKVRYAQPWARKAEQGKVLLVDGDWVGPFLQEAENFDGTGICDQIDGVSLGVAALANTDEQVEVLY